MEVAPKFPRGVIRLGGLSLALSLLLSFSDSRRLSARLRLSLSLPAYTLFFDSPPSSPVPFCNPSRSRSRAHLADVYSAFAASGGDSCSLAALSPSPRGIIKIAVRGDGANGFRDITLAKLCTRNNVETRIHVYVCVFSRMYTQPLRITLPRLVRNLKLQFPRSPVTCPLLFLCFIIRYT